MKKRKITIDKKYVLEKAYDDFVHMLRYMPSCERQVMYLNPVKILDNNGPFAL